ncbi:hypothetical protein D3C79_674450 [compost metagenome]
MPVVQRQAHLRRPLRLVEQFLNLGLQAVVARQWALLRAEQGQPARLDQGHHGSARSQFQALGAIAGNQCVDAQVAGQGQADAVVMSLCLDGTDPTVQLIACAGAQHQATEQVEVAGVFGGFQNLCLQRLQALVQAQHPLTFL